MTSRSAEKATTGAPALEIQDVVAGYGGGDVLHGVTMQVYEGGITCVVGPNGAGKSTLLAVISGLLVPRRRYYAWKIALTAAALAIGWSAFALIGGAASTATD